MLTPILLLLSALVPPSSSFSERIRIWRVRQVSSSSSSAADDSLDQEARDQFVKAMGPGRMAELRQVREDLTEIGRRLMAGWEKAGLTGPSELLAEAMATAQKREASPGRLAQNRESVSLLNRPIQEFLYQSDILMDANQSAKMLADVIAQGERERDATALTILIEDEEEQEWPGGGEEEEEWHQQLLEERRRRRRQAQTGRNFPRNQWDPARPIPFVFDPKLSSATRKLVRLAAQFWTEHTCISFAENGPGSPRVRFFPGGGCYSQVGRAFHQREQMISLGRGCEQFGIAAHEIGHTLGFFHGQARFDRDQFVNIVYSNLSPHMAGQFVKQSPEDNFNFGVNYDYGSIMHYSDTDVATSRVTMLARERVYQHTMGNNVAPSFLDVFEMNLYYKCTEHCNIGGGADCKNGGYRHPRNCSACLCPDGFGDFDCSGRAPPAFGAPPDCGGTLQVQEGELQTLDGSVSAAAALENGMAERHAQCWWHIRAPAGKRVQMRVKSVSGACSDGCFYGGTELKTRDFLRVGARVCCRSDVRPLGIMFSSTELALVSVFSQYKTQRFSIEFRAVDPSLVPRSGVADYDDLDGSEARKKQTAKETGGGGRKGSSSKEVPVAECRDIAPRCSSLLQLCDNRLYRGLMGRQCAKSCKRCGGEDGGGTAKGTAQVVECGTRDHESCRTWANNGFCLSKSYSPSIKRQICPRQCRLC